MAILSASIAKPQDAVVISFDELGGAEGLHIDKFDLGFLGKKTIVRATDIVFDEATQAWTIYLLDAQGQNPTLPWTSCKGFATYEIARQVEVGWLNLCRLNGANPRDGDGHTYLNQARKANGLTI